MNLSAIACKALSNTENFTKKNSPALLTGAGILGFGVTTYLVGRAVLKSQPVIGNLKADSAKVRSKDLSNEYTDKDQAKELGQLWVRQSVVLARIYTPAVATGLGSVACILAAHGIMRRRQAALVAAYTTLDAGFKAYRKRVQKELGEERELDLYRGANKREIEGENGEKLVVTDWDDLTPSVYSRFFDESSPNWSKTPEFNLMFLRAQQQHANDRLQMHGFVFLNEVLESLGLPRCQAGQVVGWKREAREEGTGDGYIDFGIYDIASPEARAFINGYEHTVLLDFNVDGPIRI